MPANKNGFNILPVLLGAAITSTSPSYSGFPLFDVFPTYANTFPVFTSSTIAQAL